MGTETKRSSGSSPGYDCRTECKHEPKGEHGISGGTWWYAVTDGDHAVSLELLGTDFPETVTRPLIGVLERPIPAGLVSHRADPGGEPCEFVSGGRCKSDVTYLGAHNLWEEHGDPAQREQSEAFWLALEAELDEEC
jgi:hypothetical protein